MNKGYKIVFVAHLVGNIRPEWGETALMVSYRFGIEKHIGLIGSHGEIQIQFFASGRQGYVEIVARRILW